MGRKLLSWIAGLLLAASFAAPGTWVVDRHIRTPDELTQESDRLISTYVPKCGEKTMSPGDTCLASDDEGGSYDEVKARYNATVTERLADKYRNWRIGGYTLLGLSALVVLLLLLDLVRAAVRGGAVPVPAAAGSALPPAPAGPGAPPPDGPRPGWTVPPARNDPAGSAQPSAAGTKTGRAAPIFAAVLTVLMVVGFCGWYLTSGPGADVTKKVTPWAANLCIHQTGGPTAPAPAPTTETLTAAVQLSEKLIDDKHKDFALIDCADPDAEGKITTIVDVPDYRDDAGAQKCPATTDDLHWVPPADSSDQIACVRRLASPHPGDPGAGNGLLTAGDCVTVASSKKDAVLNDRVADVPCAGTDWFATVVGVVTGTPTGNPPCPKGTASRVPHPVLSTMVVCLARGSRGAIAGQGDCVILPEYTYSAPTPVGCRQRDRVSFRIAHFTSAGSCASGETLVKATGYDQALCGESWYEGSPSQ